MAKSQTFGKRENEKKKQAKRFEKQKRREERQAGGSSSLDDMIAYVDENGNITDTPPQLRPKVEIQLEDIVIATPKKEGTRHSTRAKTGVPMIRNVICTKLRPWKKWAFWTCKPLF